MMKSSVSAVIALMVAASWGCLGGGADGTSDTTPSVANHPTSTAIATISAVTLKAWESEASEFQMRLLEDRVLTLEEYEQAKLAQVACLTDAGLTVQQPVRLNGLLRYKLTVAAPAERTDATNIIARCKREYANVIDVVWAEVSISLTQGVIEESRRMMAECYDANGLRVRDKPYDSPDPGERQKHLDCEMAVQSALDLGGVSYGVEGDGRPQ